MVVIFGHQSVGADLLDGIRELASTGTATPQIRALDAEPPPDAGTVIAAFRVGQNRDPQSKLRHFTEVAADAGARAQAALFKFCYVDVNETTDADALFESYRAAMDTLRAQRPELVLAHATVPLRTQSSGPTARIRRLLGANDRQRSANAARHAFNQRLRGRYGGSEPFFDLAAIESRDADVAPDAARVPALATDFSSDGGHLNALGRRAVARGFLEFLDRLPARDNARRPGEWKATA